MMGDESDRVRHDRAGSVAASGRKADVVPARESVYRRIIYSSQPVTALRQ